MYYKYYSTPIDCDVNDKVLVYKKNILDESGLINTDMIGTVEYIEQYPYEDWLGTEYLSYNITIRMKNGEKIVIKDDAQKPFFRKYEFVTLKDLEKIQSEQTVQ